MLTPEQRVMSAHWTSAVNRAINDAGDLPACLIGTSEDEGGSHVSVVFPDNFSRADRIELLTKALASLRDGTKTEERLVEVQVAERERRAQNN